MGRAMKRVLLLTLATGLACSTAFAQQQQSSDQNSSAQNSTAANSKTQKSADQKSKAKPKSSDSPSSSTEDNRPASERFPFPGDQPSQPTGDQTNSGNSLPNSPDDNRPASEKFPFPGDQPNQQTNAPDDNRPDKFPFPGGAPTAPPRSDPRGPNDSSSKDRNVDISPPPDDYKHEGSDLIGPEPGPGFVEMKPWNPHQADKDVEVGMYYFKQKNYPAAESRFREALYWQDNHAEALYRLGIVLEKQGKNPEAKSYYQQYLKILPNGDLARDAKKGLARVGGEDSNKAENKTPIARP